MFDPQLITDGLMNREMWSKLTSILSDTSQSTVTTGKDGQQLCPKVLRENGYSINKMIGEGTYSKVYKAKKSNRGKLEKNLAVKIIDFSKVDEEWKDNCLKNELKICSRIKHDNIVRIENVTKTTRHAFIFMELAVDTLSAYMERLGGGGLSEPRCRYWFHQLMRGLEYLHSKGVAHRDLKTENILLDENQHVRITDFGFACFTYDKMGNKLLLSDTQCGTPEYMAPEIYSGKVYDARISDVWSSGIILFEMLTGDVPFQVVRGNPRVMIAKQMRREWHFPSAYVNIISDKAKDLTNILLQPLETRRIDTSTALRHAWFSRTKR